jgi:hypothetical protein
VHSVKVIRTWSTDPSGSVSRCPSSPDRVILVPLASIRGWAIRHARSLGSTAATSSTAAG